MVKYKILVHTGDKRGAGTDANVFVILHGENGDSGKRKLESGGNNFERGRVDTFGMEMLDIGELKKVTIGHDGSGFGSGWFLDNVIVKDETLRNKEYKFQCGRWLDKVLLKDYQNDVSTFLLFCFCFIFTLTLSWQGKVNIFD